MPRIPDNLSDEELIQTVFFDALRQRYSRRTLGTESYSWAQENLPEGYRILVSTNWIEGEVSNGGFTQFFWNRLEDYNLIVADAITAYEKIGAHTQAQVLRRVLPMFEREKHVCEDLKIKKAKYAPNQTAERHRFIKWIDHAEMLDTDDMEVFWEDEEKLENMKARWIRQHPEAFLFPDEKEI